MILSAICYFSLKYILPTIPFQSPLSQGIAKALVGLALPISGFFVLTAAFSALHAWRKGELLNGQTGLSTLRKLNWKDFEYLVSEAYRRRGYEVQENLSGGADGGIDLILRKDGKATLVQCKQWKSRRVGVPVIRELYGVMNAEGAERGIIICTGDFTKDALDFARG